MDKILVDRTILLWLQSCLSGADIDSIIEEGIGYEPFYEPSDEARFRHAVRSPWELADWPIRIHNGDAERLASAIFVFKTSVLKIDALKVVYCCVIAIESAGRSRELWEDLPGFFKRLLLATHQLDQPEVALRVSVFLCSYLKREKGAAQECTAAIAVLLIVQALSEILQQARKISDDEVLEILQSWLGPLQSSGRGIVGWVDELGQKETND